MEQRLPSDRLALGPLSPAWPKLIRRQIHCKPPFTTTDRLRGQSGPGTTDKGREKRCLVPGLFADEPRLAALRALSQFNRSKQCFVSPRARRRPDLSAPRRASSWPAPRLQGRATRPQSLSDPSPKRRRGDSRAACAPEGEGGSQRAADQHRGECLPNDEPAEERGVGAQGEAHADPRACAVRPNPTLWRTAQPRPKAAPLNRENSCWFALTA